ncbi:MAG: TetR/AcrR family transcriptional regulator [Myxococcota bacterium]|nr:TetR/AcrR family transcriptional regulator [Myxococcota bacterium]
MSRKARTGEPRRRPSGTRGEAIVQALCEATERILDREGLEAATSNRVAEEAGVSIGSFYQYFPDMDALLAEMARGMELRTAALARQRVEEALEASGPGGATEAVAGALIDLLVSDALGSPKLRRVLQQHVPRAWVAGASTATDLTVGSLVRDLLVGREQADPAIDAETAAFVLVTAVEAVVEVAIAQGRLESERESLRAALRELVLGFL